MSLRVKVCGNANEEDALAVAAMGPDAMGFIFWSGSPRNADPVEVGQWNTGSAIQRVGVFVDADEQTMARIAKQARLDVIQLHGDWDALAAAASIGLPVWKVIHLKKGLPDNWASYPVDAYLLDGYSSTMPGGTGVVIDWDAAADFVSQAQRPVWLAGGLHGGNVADAVQAVGPAGVDASSRLESAPGKKDCQKVREYISACRAL